MSYVFIMFFICSYHNVYVSVLYVSYHDIRLFYFIIILRWTWTNSAETYQRVFRVDSSSSYWIVLERLSDDRYCYVRPYDTFTYISNTYIFISDVKFHFHMICVKKYTYIYIIIKYMFYIFFHFFIFTMIRIYDVSYVS